MSKSNLPLLIAGLLIGYMAWIAYDMSQPTGTSSSTASIAVVRTAKVPVLVEFYADWCGPCRQVGPEVEQLARELKGKAEVVRINVDEQPDLARDNGVRGIPCFIAFRNGRETGREVGGIPKTRMRSLLGL